MKITKERSTYHKYALESEYDAVVVSYCQFLKQSFGYENFSWDGAKWRFTNLSIALLLKDKFPHLEIEPDILTEIGLAEIQREKEIEREEVAEKIKEGISSNLEIKGIKGELYPYQKLGVEFLLNSGGKALLADSPGCIAGDEKIIVNRGGNARTYTMRELFAKTTQGIKTYSIGPMKRPLGFDPSLLSLTRSMTKDGVFRLNTIKEVIYSGIKPTITISARSKDGKSYKVRLTKDHEVAIPDKKWIKAGELGIGDTIVTNGKLPKIKWCDKCKDNTRHSTYVYGMFPGECKQCIYRFLRKNTSKGKSGIGGEHPDKRGYVMVTGVYFHPSLIRKVKVNKSNRKATNDKGVRKHILMYESFLNNVSYNEWINFGRNNNYPKECVFIDSKVHAIHHKNGIVNDNRIENLQMLTHREHAAMEGREYKFTNISEFFLPVEAIITKIEESKETDVYDIIMDDPNRNFIVNGIVVHNCGKSLQALGYVTHSGHERTLIVCPASVKFSWEGEIKKWTHLKSFVIDPKTDLKDVPYDINCVIVNFDILKKFYNEFMKYDWNCLIVDECVIPQTYIATKEGQKQVIDLVPGEMILTYNLDKKIYEYKPLVRVIKKPLLKKLTQVRDLVCTEDHKIYNGKDFVEAKDVKETFPMNFLPIVYGESDEILAGCLMGDASLRVNPKGVVNARLEVGNCIKNRDYIEMKCRIINYLDIDRLKTIWNNGYKPSEYFKVVSLTNTKLTELHRKTYVNGERVIDTSILDMMGIAGLAVWLQDDGSCVSGMLRLNTQRYKRNGNEVIIKWFKDKYDISPVIGTERKKDGRVFFYLSFYVKDSLKLYRLIRDYIVPSMRYKFVSLESRFNKIYTNVCRVCGQRMFGLHNVSQHTVKQTKVCDICRENYGSKPYKNKNFVRINPYNYVYDLEIEDNHNYFADGILIHNCHMIKSESAIRTKVVKNIAKKVPNVIMLTGTPVLSRPIEIFNVLNIIDPMVWNSWYRFAIRYAGGQQTHWGFEAKGATNLEELKGKISKYFLRRTKEEVLKELPPKNFIEVPIDLPEEERKQYELAENNLVKYLKEYKKDKTKEEIVKSLAAEKLVKLNLLREINAMGKIPTVRELIDSIVDADEKVLVFSSFNAPLEELADMYEENSVMIIGSTPVDERQEMVRKFQEDKNTQIFFGGTKSAGVGITLTAASHVICLDLPWNPADLEQQINRAHRPGAEYESLNIYQILSRDSIDGFMKKLLQRKQEIIDKIIGGEEVEDEKGMVDEYLESLKVKYKNKK